MKPIAIQGAVPRARAAERRDLEAVPRRPCARAAIVAASPRKPHHPRCPRRLAALVGAVAASVALLAACGRTGEERTGDLPPVPPRWRAAPTPLETPDGGEPGAAAIEVGTPVHLALVAEGFEDTPRILHERDVPAGVVLGLSWRVALPPPERMTTSTPPAAEAKAGRVEPHVVRVTAGFDDTASVFLTALVWTRPGRGRAEARSVPPPLGAEALPIDGEVELVTAWIADAAEGAVRWTAQDGRTTVRLEGRGAEDRLRVVRLLLRVTPLAPGG